jgi:mono/diheme cytochrome c family protein
MLMRIAVLALAVAGTASAQDVDPVAGRDLYLNLCAQCHGDDAKGNGPMAKVMAIVTPDLTGIATRNDGIFPTGAVAMQIDGRMPLLAHGGDMPIYGTLLETDKSVALRLPSGQLMMMGVPLANLVVYLKTLQAK